LIGDRKEETMIHKVEATYDGEIVRPEEPLHLAPHSRFTMSYEGLEDQPQAKSEIARSMQVEGPPDWSERLDHYLYGGMVGDGDE
jgi:hypothetical protein